MKNENLFSRELKSFLNGGESYLNSTSIDNLVLQFVNYFKAKNQQFNNDLFKESNYLYAHLDLIILGVRDDFRSFLLSLVYIGTSNRFDHYFNVPDLTKVTQRN